MRVRRAVIAFVLFVVAIVVLLKFSRAPMRVDSVWVLTQFLLVSVVTFFLCATSLSPTARMIGVTIGVITVSVITTWLSSMVIASLRPLEAIYFGMDLVTSTIEATVVVGVVWTIDFVVDRLMRLGAHKDAEDRADDGN